MQQLWKYFLIHFQYVQKSVTVYTKNELNISFQCYLDAKNIQKFPLNYKPTPIDDYLH